MSTDALRIISFGRDHKCENEATITGLCEHGNTPGSCGELMLPPEADITVDVRYSLKDPHVTPEFCELTGLDQAVHDHVAAMIGVPTLVAGMHMAAQGIAYHAQEPVTVAIFCIGGRHRSVVLANLLAEWARNAPAWKHVTVEHRDVQRPVIKR